MDIIKKIMQNICQEKNWYKQETKCLLGSQRLGDSFPLIKDKVKEPGASWKSQNHHIFHINVKSLKQMSFLIECACRIDGPSRALSVIVSSTDGVNSRTAKCRTDVQATELLSPTTPSVQKMWTDACVHAIYL